MVATDASVQSFTFRETDDATSHARPHVHPMAMAWHSKHVDVLAQRGRPRHASRRLMELR